MNRPTLTAAALLLASVHAPPMAAADEPPAVTESDRPEIYRSKSIDFNKNGKLDPYEDPALKPRVRVRDLLSRMTIEEKTCQLATLYGYQRVLRDDLPTAKWKDKVWKDGIANIDEHLNGIPEWRNKRPSKHTGPPSAHARAINEVQRWFVEQTRLGIPVDFTNEGIRGLCYQGATNFPAQVGVGATWDVDLARRIGEVTGREAKAVGYTNIYSPILDVARDPRWGRVVECYGEDPFHVGTLGTAQALGLQSAGVASTAKHFAVYGAPKGGRDGEARTDPQLTRREMLDMHLTPFEMAIRNAGLLGVMSSYNDYDGVPVSGSREFLMDQLRGRMGFRGYVVSDSNAVEYLYKKHRVVGSYRAAAVRFLESGGNVRTNFTSPSGFINAIRDAVERREISQQTIDARVAEVLRVKFELGLFDDPFVRNPSRADDVVGCREHREIALEAAQKSIVLLKNDGVLPLSRDLGSILVCGPNANSTGHSISRYGPVGGEVVSLLEGVRAAVGDGIRVEYAKGCEVVDRNWPKSDFYEHPLAEDEAALLDEAVELARKADVVVLALGESETTIGESKSRVSLALTGRQRLLARRLHATGKPVVVVLMQGRALAINWVDDHIPAVLSAWFPGEACGTAIAGALFGDFSPGGKLPITVPRTVGQVPLAFPFKRSSHAGQGSGHNPNGVGQSRMAGPLYPFGHGLSYTRFEYTELKIEPAEISPSDSATVTCRVHNAGDRPGDEVVQLYVEDQVSSLVTYERVLRGFQRVSLEPGESTEVTFSLPASSLALTGLDNVRRVEPGAFTVSVGSSSEDLRLSDELSVPPPSEVAQRPSQSVE
ncbi:MAG: glycoside hydrolase family 3 N-terminal domain-containing protein [Planctomycetota bacterium]